jgi:outer membrane protein TolC
MASWSPFTGASQIADARATSARRDAAQSTLDAAEAAVVLERERSLRLLRTALARLDVAERSVRQSIDAHRIVSRRYDAGTVSIAELLDAAAIETQQHLALANTRYDLIVAAAARRRALGLDPGALGIAGGSDTTPTPRDQ